MRDFHIFWMQYGMDHYLFLHLIAFIIEKYSVLNDNKEPLLRRPNTKCVTASAQLLGVAFHVSPTPWAEWAAHPRLPGGKGKARAPQSGNCLVFPSIHVPCFPSTLPTASGAQRMLLQLLGMRWLSSLVQAPGSKRAPGASHVSLESA